MAIKEMTPVMGVLNKVTEFVFEAATAAADGLSFKLPKTIDSNIVVVIQNTDTGNAHSITVKKPTSGSYYASGDDETFELAEGAFAVFRFESAKWADKDGTIKLVPDNAAVKAAVLY